MSLRRLTDRNAVISAIEEFDRVGPAEFYRQYGFGKALKFFILHDGRQYDSKAILAVAHKYQFGSPLKNTFSGGVATVVPVLRAMGFVVTGVRIDEATVRLPEEVSSDLWEGAKKQVSVNAYERNSVARIRCIEAHGHCCAICDFDFGEVYGLEFSGFIHVHHRIPLSQVDRVYKIDPVADLLPVCPNCHAVLHHGGVDRTVDEVRRLLQAPNRRRGPRNVAR